MGSKGEGGGGGAVGLNAPRKSQSYTGLDPLETNKATKPALNVGPLFCWQANDSLLSMGVGSFSLQSDLGWTPMTKLSGSEQEPFFFYRQVLS